MQHIYYWFSGLYHNNLFDYLRGLDCNTDSNLPNQFNGIIGLVTLGIACLLCVLFYLVRHAKFNGIISWLVVCLLVAAFSWGYGYGIIKYQEKEIPSYVVYGYDNCEFNDDGDNGTYNCNSLQPISGATPIVTEQSYIGFGFANMFVGMLFFIFISFIIKRFSRDCRHTPWVSLWPKH